MITDLCPVFSRFDTWSFYFFSIYYWLNWWLCSNHLMFDSRGYHFFLMKTATFLIFEGHGSFRGTSVNQSRFGVGALYWDQSEYINKRVIYFRRVLFSGFAETSILLFTFNALPFLHIWIRKIWISKSKIYWKLLCICDEKVIK